MAWLAECRGYEPVRGAKATAIAGGLWRVCTSGRASSTLYPMADVPTRARYGGRSLIVTAPFGEIPRRIRQTPDYSQVLTRMARGVGPWIGWGEGARAESSSILPGGSPRGARALPRRRRSWRWWNSPNRRTPCL
jgi:hypothetical protein